MAGFLIFKGMASFSSYLHVISMSTREGLSAGAEEKS